MRVCGMRSITPHEQSHIISYKTRLRSLPHRLVEPRCDHLQHPPLLNVLAQQPGGGRAASKAHTSSAKRSECTRRPTVHATSWSCSRRGAPKLQLWLRASIRPAGYYHVIPVRSESSRLPARRLSPTPYWSTSSKISRAPSWSMMNAAADSIGALSISCPGCSSSSSIASSNSPSKYSA